MRRQWSAGHRYKRYDKRIHAEIDEYARSFVQRLNGIAEARKEVGADLSTAKNLNRGSERFQIESPGHFRLTGHDPPSHVFIPSLKVHSQRIDAGLTHPRKPSEVGRRLALTLDRQTRCAFNGRSTLCQHRSTAVFGWRRAGGHDDVCDTVESLGSNQYGFNIEKDTYSFGNTPLSSDTTYWITLQNASVASGDPVYWDENGGPSQAQENTIGTIPSESFTVLGSSNTTTTSTSTTTTGTVPEPSSIMLFGSGILGLAGMLRRKLF